MSVVAAVDVSQDQTAICVAASDGAILAEGKVATCPDAIASRLSSWKDDIERTRMETGPLAGWLWNALSARSLHVICLDARHANRVLKMMPNKIDRRDARGLAQIAPPAGSGPSASRVMTPMSPMRRSPPATRSWACAATR